MADSNINDHGKAYKTREVYRPVPSLININILTEIVKASGSRYPISILIIKRKEQPPCLPKVLLFSLMKLLSRSKLMTKPSHHRIILSRDSSTHTNHHYHVRNRARVTNQFSNNNNTLTKEEWKELLRAFLPSCQPQEGSPPNTFTQSELDDLKKAIRPYKYSRRKNDSYVLVIYL